MEKAIVIGPFGFIGYGICRHLLDSGLQVWGLETSQASSPAFQVEKRMEIGRNANYMDEPEEGWFESKGEGIVLFIPFYDYFMEREEEQLYLGGPIFPEAAEKFIAHVSSAVLILPRQFADGQSEGPAKIQLVKQFLEEKVQGNIAIAYIPTIYGPWQPNHYFFQQLLFPCPGKTPVLDEREPAGEAVYIDDAAILLAELADQQGDFWIRSGNERSWEKGLSVLADRPEADIGKEMLPLAKEDNSGAACPGFFTQMQVQHPVQMEEGLRLQRLKYEQWLSMWSIKG